MVMIGTFPARSLISSLVDSRINSRLSEQWQISIDLFSWNLKQINISQLLSGSGGDDVLHDNLILALQAVGGAQERHGVADEAGEEDLPAAGDLCGVAVRLGHPWRRLDQVVLEWGDVQSWSICAMQFKSFLITSTN